MRGPILGDSPNLVFWGRWLGIYLFDLRVQLSCGRRPNQVLAGTYMRVLQYGGLDFHADMAVNGIYLTSDFCVPILHAEGCRQLNRAQGPYYCHTTSSEIRHRF